MAELLINGIVIRVVNEVVEVYSNRKETQKQFVHYIYFFSRTERNKISLEFTTKEELKNFVKFFSENCSRGYRNIPLRSLIETIENKGRVYFFTDEGWLQQSCESDLIGSSYAQDNNYKIIKIKKCMEV